MLGVANAVLRTVGATLPPPSAQLIGRWPLDEGSGATATDAAGHSNGSYTGVALNQDPLVENDPGTSVRFFGNSAVAVPHVAAYEVGSYSVVVYGQVQAGPGPGANAILVQKDRPSLPGGFHLGIVNTGGTLRLQAYTKDHTGNSIWVGSPNGVGQVVPNTAFMLVMTCGGSGTRLYLDKTEIGSSNNHVGLIDNNEQIGIGRYRPGIGDTAGFDGWIDEVRFYQGVLTQAEIDALANAQDLVTPPVEQAAYTLPAVPTAPSGTTRYVSSGVGSGAPAAGNDSSGNGTIGNPYRTLGRALAVANSGDQIILRKGIYREANLSISDTNLTIKGYDQDIAADPLDPDNWPIIDGGINMSPVTWELVDAGRQEYRTQQTVGSLGLTGDMIGCFAYAGTGTYRVPRWEPLNGIVEPNKGNRLAPYASHNTNDDWSLNCFRHTGAVATSDLVTYYYGPGVAVIGDRVHIRLQPCHSSVMGGQVIDDFHGNYNPVNHSIFLWSEDRNLFSGMATGFTLEGVFVRNYDSIRRPIDVDNVTIRRCVLWGMHYHSAPTSVENADNFLFQHNVAVAGLSDWHQWGTGKHSPFQQQWGANMGRIGFPGSMGGVCANYRVLDNLILRSFDIAWGDTSPGTTIEVAYNAMEVIDDTTQCNNSTNEHVHHNFIIGPLIGCGGDTPPAGNRYHTHHNVCLLTRWRAWRATLMWSWTIYTPHSPQAGRNHRIYHNTFVFTNPRRESSIRTSALPHGPSNLRNAEAGQVQYVVNNIFTVVNREAPGINTTPHRNIMGEFAAGAEGVLDGNAYHKVDLDGLSGGDLFTAVYHGGGVGTNAANYASLAAMKSGKGPASQSFYQARGLTSIEFNGIQADPQFVGGSDAFVNEGRDVPPGYYIPENTAYHTGAINLGSGGLNLGLPDYTYEPWRGALDPNGDGTEVGPRAA
jgi:Concanavalin A-like lectin/glucanases superfamily